MPRRQPCTMHARYTTAFRRQPPGHTMSATDTTNDRSNNLIWIDLEMTGLDTA